MYTTLRRILYFGLLLWGFAPLAPLFAQTTSDLQLRLNPGGHTAQINKLLVTSTGQVVTASDDKTIRLWDVERSQLRESRKILGQIGDGSGEVYAIALSPDGRLLASGGLTVSECPGECVNIRLHDFQTGELKTLLQSHTNVVLDLAFSPDGQWLASSSSDQTVRVWPLPSGIQSSEAAFVLEGHQAEVYAVRWLPDGQHLVSASYDHTVRLWRLPNGGRPGQRLTPLAMARHEDRVHSLAVGPDWIASAGADKTIRLWDFSLRPLRTMHSETRPTGLEVHPNGRLLLAGAGSRPIKVNVWDTQTGRLLHSYEGHQNLTQAVGWLDAQTAISAGGDNNEIDLWQLPSTPRGSLTRLSRAVGVGQTIWAVGLQGDQVGWGNTFDYSSHQQRGPLEHTFDLETLSLQPLSAQEQRAFAPLPTHYGPLQLRHEAGGDYGLNDAVLVIEERGQEKARIVRDATNGLGHKTYGFTPDGRIVSGGSNGQLSIYDTEGQELAHLVGHEGEVRTLAVEGQRLLSGSADQTLRVWDLGAVNDFTPEIDWE